MEKSAPVDEKRLGLYGHSYGGWMSMWANTQTRRFKAIVAGAGIANWKSYYGQNGIDEWMIPFFGASVYDDPAIYRAASPISFIKKAKTPTLIYVGERDVECPAPQSLEYWHALSIIARRQAGGLCRRRPPLSQIDRSGGFAGPGDGLVRALPQIRHGETGGRMAARNNGTELALYLGAVTLFSAVFWALIIQAGHVAAGGGHYVEGLMWCPAIAALLVIAFRRLDIKTLGLASFGGRYALLGYVTPLVYAFIAYALVWGLGLGGFPNAAASPHFPRAWAGMSARPVRAALFRSDGHHRHDRRHGARAGRGDRLARLLAPRMVAQWGFTKGAVVAGVVWAAWHMPLMLFADYNSGTPLWFALSCFAVFVIACSVMLTWIRLKSQSVWPCAILHASHNLFIQTFFTPLTAPRGAVTAYAIDEFGVATPAVALAIAFLFWRARDQVASADRKIFA